MPRRRVVVRRRPPGLADWVARGVALAGGFMLLRTLSPRGRKRASAVDEVFIGAQNEAMGRGEAAVPPSPESAKAGYEVVDLSGGTLGKLMLGLCALVCAVIGLMVWMENWMTTRLEAGRPAYTAEQTAALPPPSPTVAVAKPLEELAQSLGRQKAQLEGYAWVDAQQTRARIPIDRAKQLIVGKPLDRAP